MIYDMIRKQNNVVLGVIFCFYNIILWYHKNEKMTLRTRLKSKTKMSVPKKRSWSILSLSVDVWTGKYNFWLKPLECFVDTCNKVFNKHAPPPKRKLGEAINFLVQITITQVTNEIRHHLQITHYSKLESGRAFSGPLQTWAKRESKRSKILCKICHDMNLGQKVLRPVNLNMLNIRPYSTNIADVSVVSI